MHASGGVTQQTLLNHFTSREGLFLAMTDLLGQEVEALRGTPAPGDTTAVARSVVRQYERYGDADVRLAEAAERIPALRPVLERRLAYHRQWLQDVFSEHLPEDPPSRRRVLTQLHVATDAVGRCRPSSAQDPASAAR